MIRFKDVYLWSSHCSQLADHPCEKLWDIGMFLCYCLSCIYYNRIQQDWLKKRALFLHTFQYYKNEELR